MRSRKKYFSLSQKGINDAIAYLESYKKQLILKTQKLLEELAKIGIREADARFAEASNEATDTSHAYIKSVSFANDRVTMDICVTGDDLIFIEFGAGVHYNGHKGESAHRGQKFREKYPEFRIGKYGTNGEKEWSLGANDYWYYDGNKTYGTKATMPVYGAYQAMAYEVLLGNAVRKAFSDWS